MFSPAHSSSHSASPGSGLVDSQAAPVGLADSQAAPVGLADSQAASIGTATAETLAHRKSARAAKAREGKTRLARLRAATQPAKPPPPQRGWESEAKEHAAHALLWQPTLASMRALARMLHVDRRFLSRLAVIAASRLLGEQSSAFAALLSDVRRGVGNGRLRPRMFAWSRMYDETPARAWTHVIKDSGAKEGHAAVAKVMASLLSFSMVLEVAHDGQSSGGSAASRASPTALAGAEDAQPCPSFLVVRGSFLQRLAAMADQSQEIVLQAIRSTMNLTPCLRQTVEELFPVTVVLRQSDLHRSGLAAEREEARVHSKWVSTLFRCSMHRARTAEIRTLGLDHRTESFFLNYTLVLRQQPDAVRAYRARVEAWVTARLTVYQGRPPEEVTRWRRAMGHLMFHDDSRSRSAHARQYCWERLTNGDGRIQHEVQHYCDGHACCPGGRAETLRKLLGPCGISALLQPVPPVFPRKSWHGQCECIAHVIQQEATHGMISNNFKPMEAAARQRAAKAAQRAAEERRREVASQAPGLLSRSPAPIDGGGMVAADEAMRFAEEAAQRCKDVMDFLLTPGSLQNMIRFRLVLEGFRELKATILKRNGSPPQSLCALWPGLGWGRVLGSRANQGRNENKARQNKTRRTHRGQSGA
jgi:hypothetical protein